VDAPQVDPGEPRGLWRVMRWYPLAVLALLVALWWFAPRRTVVAPPEPEAEPVVAQVEEPESEPAVEQDTFEVPEESSLLQDAATKVARAFGSRLASGIGELREHVGREELEQGSLKAARLAPFIGPFLRFQRARQLYHDGDAEQRAAAERQAVIALSALVLDVGVAGMGHIASGSEGLMQVLEGAVDVADFADFALGLQAEFGPPLGWMGLDRLDLRLDTLAGLALSEIAGLEPLIVALLTADLPEWVTSVPPEVLPAVQSLLRELIATGAGGN